MNHNASAFAQRATARGAPCSASPFHAKEHSTAGKSAGADREQHCGAPRRRRARLRQSRGGATVPAVPTRWLSQLASNWGGLRAGGHETAAQRRVRERPRPGASWRHGGSKRWRDTARDRSPLADGRVRGHPANDQSDRGRCRFRPQGIVGAAHGRAPRTGSCRRLALVTAILAESRKQDRYRPAARSWIRQKRNQRQGETRICQCNAPVWAGNYGASWKLRLETALHFGNSPERQQPPTHGLT
jgi:hypothetical protein